jgi:hypothetical protein
MPVMALRRDLIDLSVAAHHGRIVKPAGDGSVIESAAWSMWCAAPCRPSRPPSPQPPPPGLLRDANQRGERPPPLNVARLTAIAPDACRLH